MFGWYIHAGDTQKTQDKVAVLGFWECGPLPVTSRVTTPLIGVITLLYPYIKPFIFGPHKSISFNWIE